MAPARAAETLKRALATLFGSRMDEDDPTTGEAEVALQQLETAKKGAKSARAWVASVMQADAIGTIDSKDLADAYVAFFQARARLLSTTYEWNIATVRLRRATGDR